MDNAFRMLFEQFFANFFRKHPYGQQTILGTKEHLKNPSIKKMKEYYDTYYLIGYPAGHGQDNNINDHHFHWGYFIHAASFIEQFEPGWADNWGEMVNHLVRDAASPNRNDPDYPFLRSFSPFAGHCWANG